MKRISTVTGDAVKNPSNILYSIGTSYQELVDAAGGFKSQPEKIISGGPMMGFAMFSLDIPTTKTSSSILCFTHDEVAAFEPQACINCGRCVEACPEQLIQAVLRSLVCVDRWMSLRSGMDLSVLSVEAVHLHVRQGDRWLSLLRQ